LAIFECRCALLLAVTCTVACHRPADGWTWVSVAGSSCSDGTETGFGYDRSPSSANVLVVFQGGGQCYGFDSCVAREETITGPYRLREFAIDSHKFSGVLDRGDPDNPFRDWNLVYIPYCTGDFHGGSSATSYASPTGATATFHHVGHADVLAFLRVLTEEFPAPGKLVISGVSAGGYGAALNYEAMRSAWAPAEAYLIDDSGPFLPGDGIPAADRAGMYAYWRLDRVLDPLCGAACRLDLSVALSRLAARFPRDRMALLSSMRDHDISDTFRLGEDSFQAGLLALTRDALDPTANFRTFITAGDTHTMLFHPATHTTGGKALPAWLAAMVLDEPDWASALPAATDGR